MRTHAGAVRLLHCVSAPCCVFHVSMSLGVQVLVLPVRQPMRCTNCPLLTPGGPHHAVFCDLGGSHAAEPRLQPRHDHRGRDGCRR